MNNDKRIYYALAPEFECVFLINGAFNEKAGDISYPEDSPLYVTVLPLKALLLPYTVKLVGGRVISNAELARSNELAAKHFQISLKERYNYVYSPSAATETPSKGTPQELFRRVKAGDLKGARSLMTKELSESIDDAALSAFFADYDSIIESKFKSLPFGYYLFNTQTQKPDPFRFDMLGGLVDDIGSEP